MSRGRTPLPQRYGPDDLRVLTAEELRAYTTADSGLDGGDLLAWELLYRLEPTLYQRLVAAERLHPDIVAWLPSLSRRAIEIGAGTGRLTLELAPRCRQLLAIEPVPELRSLLEERLAVAGADHVTVAPGFFHDIPAPDGEADLVIACSALTPHQAHGGEVGLAEMERVCAPGGRIVIVWPTRPEWLVSRGYHHQAFEGKMAMEFATLDEAVELTAIFFPDAVERVLAGGSSSVPYELIGAPRPCDVAWKDLPG